MTRKKQVRAVIFDTVKKQKALSLGIVSTVIGAVVFALIPPLILADIVDSITAGTDAAFARILLYFAMLALTGFTESARESLLVVFGQKITHALRSSLMDKFTHLTADNITKQEPGTLVSRFVGDVDTVETLFSSGIISMFADACRIISILVVIWFQNRGLAIVLLVLLPFSDNIPLLFVGGALLTSAIELVGGWALKKFFHTTWWDYSDQPFNLGGYICLKFSILWGLCVVVVIRIVHTAIASLVHWIPFTLGAILVGIFIALFITDTVVTVLTIRKLNEKLTVINDMSARLRKESDAISNGLGRLTLLADEKITEQKQEFNEKARPVLEEKLQAQRAQLSEKYEEYRASLEDRRVKAQKSAEDLRAQWNSVTSKLQRHTQRRLMRAFPTMKNDRADEALRRLRAWMDEKKDS